VLIRRKTDERGCFTRRSIVSLSEDLKAFALGDLDMDYVGISSVERLSEAPEGYRPTDLLPGAKSIVVMAVRLLEGAVQAIFRAHEDGLRHALCIYGSHGYVLTPNLSLNFAGYRMARFLEKMGFIATPLPSGPGGGGVPFSHRHAAVAAGLGELGWSGLLITPDYGPRVRLVSVITKADIEPDPLYQGPRLCDPVSCGVCVATCPMGALGTEQTNTVVIGGKLYEYGVTNIIKCFAGIEGLTKKTLGFKDLPIPENPTWDDIDKARDQIDPRQTREAILINRPTYYCGKCLAYCPAGR
jgi:epoxyqueuosine reductase QueG